MPWEWFETAEEIVGELERLSSNEFREHVIKRYKDLARKVMEFQRIYFGSGEDTSLGYALIYRGDDIKIKALIAHGKNDVYVEAIDIEEWLEGYKQVVEVEASG